MAEILVYIVWLLVGGMLIERAVSNFKEGHYFFFGLFLMVALFSAKPSLCGTTDVRNMKRRLRKGEKVWIRTV